MGLHRLRVDAADVDELVVIAIDEIALEVEHIGEAAGKASSEVDAGTPEYAHDTAGHVLTTVVSRSLDDSNGARITHGKALAGDAGRVQVPARGAVETGVAHDDGFVRHITGIARRAQDNLAARHSLPDVIVGIAFEIQMQTAGVPDAEALSDVTGQAYRQRRLFHSVVAPSPGDLAGE